jgi:hypothetical protein
MSVIGTAAVCCPIGGALSSNETASQDCSCNMLLQLILVSANSLLPPRQLTCQTVIDTAAACCPAGGQGFKS